MKQGPVGAVAPITLWFRKNEKSQFEHNHVEEGHCADATTHPAPKTDAQKSAWGRGVWVYEHAWFDASLPPKVLRDDVESTRMEMSKPL
jgi:hypothetical protein